jgi:hypothetical protein
MTKGLLQAKGIASAFFIDEGFWPGKQPGF